MTDPFNDDGTPEDPPELDPKDNTLSRESGVGDHSRATYGAAHDDDETVSARIADSNAPSAHEHGGHGHGNAEGATLRQLGIVALLLVTMLLLHRFAVTGDEQGYDPTAMLALGFVILASFTIGALVDVIKLPHITGYLLAGMFFGPSIVGLIRVRLWPPFDEGVLNPHVIEQLSPLNTLAVALIALTAGGELRFEEIRRGLRAISGVLLAQLVTVLAVTTAFFWFVSGAIPSIALPGLGDVSAAWLPIGLTVGSISFATSPAATVAIMNETGSKGPMTRTVMSTVVLKDVFVVVLFGVFSTMALQSLGAGSDGSMGKLVIEIGGSILAGIGLGAVMGLYLKYVEKELMLFVTGSVYVTTLIASSLHLDAVLIFLTAGFLVANYSKRGETLIHSVEKLSVPVYVVFFTIAGAKLHLDEVAHLAGFAIALVLTRIGAIWVGVRLGAAIGGADDGTRKYGWMGFLSQAGVAITFAGFLGSDRFPEEIHALSSLLIAGVAINEVIGPVLLKVGLSLAGETADSKQNQPDAETDGGERVFEPWPEASNAADWGPPLDLRCKPVEASIHNIESDLRRIVNDVDLGPMEAFGSNATHFLRSLRREFLRHHRRLLVQARSIGQQETGEARTAARKALGAMLRSEQAELAERWRTLVLTRAAQQRKRADWSPVELVDLLDATADNVPASAELPYAPESFQPRSDESAWMKVRRLGLRTRRALASLFGNTMTRDIAFRELATYHLSGLTPPRLEAVAALLVDGERHLAGRTRNLFEGIVRAYDNLAADIDKPGIDLEQSVLALRGDVEEGLELAIDEVQRMRLEGTERTARTLAKGLVGLKQDLRVIGTLDLAERQRRGTAVFRERVRALEQLSTELHALRDSCGGELSMLALELELVGLEARLKEVVQDERDLVESRIERRVVQQAVKVDEAVTEALAAVTRLFTHEADATGAELAMKLKEYAEPAEKIAADATRITREMREDLLDESMFAELAFAVRRASDGLTARYDVIAGRMLRGDQKLPKSVPSVEVPFRELVSEFAETTVMPELIHAGRTGADTLAPMTAALAEVSRLLAFNVELATAELDIFHDEPVPAVSRRQLNDMIFGQLDRAHETVRALAEESATYPRTTGAEVQHAVLGALSELRGRLVDGEITKAKLDVIRKIATRRRLAQQAAEFPQLVADLRDRFRSSVVAIVGADRLARWRHQFGIAPAQEEGERAEMAFAAPAPVVELPLVYRRLFAADTMEASDVLTGRDALIRSARSTLAPRQRIAGRRRAIALVGPDGVGKVPVGSAIVRGGGWKNVAKLTLDRPQTVEDVEALLASAKHAQLVVIDGLHWLLSSKPGGFAPLRAFLRGMLNDGDARAWLVYADALFWRYASAVAPLEDAFPDLIELKPMTAEELQMAVMQRHRLSGFEHSFERFDSTQGIDGVLRRLVSRIRSPYEQYFVELHAATGGLVRDALRLWLSSIRSIESDNAVRVGPVPRSGAFAIRELPEADLQTLFLIARQGWMDAPVLANLKRRDEATAQAELGRLKHLGILESEDDVFRIATHLRGIVPRILEERSWI